MFCNVCEFYGLLKWGGGAILLDVTPPIHYSFLLYPIRRNTFSKKDSSFMTVFFTLYGPFLQMRGFTV